MMREFEAAPAGGSPPPSSKPNKTTNDLSMMTRELGGFYGLKPSDYLKGPITSFEPLNLPGQPRTSSPVMIDMEDADGDGDMKGKVMYSTMQQDKMLNPNGTQYNGKLQDKKFSLRNRKHNTSRTLDDIMLGPLGMKGPGGGMGGMPPMGGGGGGMPI